MEARCVISHIVRTRVRGRQQKPACRGGRNIGAGVPTAYRTTIVFTGTNCSINQSQRRNRVTGSGAWLLFHFDICIALAPKPPTLNLTLVLACVHPYFGQDSSRKQTVIYLSTADHNKNTPTMQYKGGILEKTV